MTSVINDYISRELVSDPAMLPLREDSSLLRSGILDSLSLLKLVLFLEKQFSITVAPEDLIPEYFETVEAICMYLQTHHRLQGAQT